MRRLWSLVIILWGLIVPLHGAEAPDSGRSSAAVDSLRRTLGGESSLDLPGLAEQEFASVPLTRDDAEQARTLLWEAHRAFIRKERTAEIEARVLKEGDLAMPFFYQTFGEKPEGGRSLWISLHGGGGAPKPVNDQQWENQKRLYKIEEGIYLAPRAPTNTWNLWHEGHIDRLFGRLIEDLIVLEEVNPDRVYVLGYSAGGDGVYQIGPRMADTWAGAAMMAGHPNGVSLLSLRNVPFALQVGGNDSAYNRNTVGRQYGEQLGKLREADPEGYPHFVRIHEGKGHWMDREDAAALPWMAEHTRNPIPERIVWKQTGTPHDRSYWLALPKEEVRGDSLVIARRKDQQIEIETAEGVARLCLRLDDRMLNLDESVRVRRGDQTLFEGTPPRTIGVLARTLSGRGDPRLMFSAEVEVDLGTATR